MAAAYCARKSDGILVHRPVRIEGMVPCCAYFSGTRDLCSTACRCVPAIKGVTRPGDSRQCPIGAVVGHRLACLRWCISAILIESNRVLVRRPVRIESTSRRRSHNSVTRYLCSTILRCVPAIKGVTRPGRRRRQIAICAVIGHGFARRINRTTVGIERCRTDFADIQNKKNVEVTDNGKDDF